jgi:hypothetical protein
MAPEGVGPGPVTGALGVVLVTTREEAFAEFRGALEGHGFRVDFPRDGWRLLQGGKVRASARAKFFEGRPNHPVRPMPGGPGMREFLSQARRRPDRREE